MAPGDVHIGLDLGLSELVFVDVHLVQLGDRLVDAHVTIRARRVRQDTAEPVHDAANHQLQ